MHIQMRQPGNGEISSEHPEQMRDVFLTNVTFQKMALVSTDLQSPVATFLLWLSHSYPYGKRVKIEFLSKWKVSALQNLNKFDHIFL